MTQDITPNPYQIPGTQLTQAGEIRLRRVPAMNGLEWLTDAWGLFRRRPGLFIGLTLLMAIINFALGMVPLIGLFASLLSPVFLGGFALAASKIDRGEPAEVGDLFAGFKQNFSQLLVVGAIFLGIGFVLMMVGGIVVAVCFALGFNMNTGLSPGLLVTGMMAIMVAFLLIMALFITMSYAAMIVMLTNCEPVAAYREAFNAFLVNFMPFLVFSAASAFLYGVSALPLTLGLIDTDLLLVGVLPMLGFVVLVVSPWMTIAIYTGVKDMFEAVSNAVNPGA
ncbi:MAG TPA: BPSS1780 family membrane protein [Dongiaceae bacterium]|nr:BPSS1780 family membrane protein [Dongiaceae bacterium]